MVTRVVFFVVVDAIAEVFYFLLLLLSVLLLLLRRLHVYKSIGDSPKTLGDALHNHTPLSQTLIYLGYVLFFEGDPKFYIFLFSWVTETTL